MLRRSPVECTELHSRRQTRWGLVAGVSALMMLFGAIGFANHLLTHQGFPLGRARIYAPWFRGTVTQIPNLPTVEVSVKDLEDDPGQYPSPILSPKIVVMSLRYPGPYGSEEVLTVMREQDTVKLSPDRGLGPKVSFSRRFGFFVLEQ